jgi:hypothetical protein
VSVKKIIYRDSSFPWLFFSSLLLRSFPTILLLAVRLGQTFMMRSLTSTLPFFSLTFATLSHNLLPRQISNQYGITLPIYNDLAHQHYLVNITVGTPPNLYTVMFDTGSTDFWLPAWNSSGCAPNPCKPGTFNPAASETAVDINIPFNVSYGLTPGSGMLGEYYNDSVSLGSAALTRQTVRLPSSTSTSHIT